MDKLSRVTWQTYIFALLVFDYLKFQEFLLVDVWEKHTFLIDGLSIYQAKTWRGYGWIMVILFCEKLVQLGVGNIPFHKGN